MNEEEKKNIKKEKSTEKSTVKKTDKKPTAKPVAKKESTAKKNTVKKAAEKKNETKKTVVKAVKETKPKEVKKDIKKSDVKNFEQVTQKEKTNKGFTKSISIAIFTIGIIILVLTIIYMSTDFFKSEKELFYKYSGQIFEENKNLDGFIDNLKKLKGKSYESETKIDLDLAPINALISNSKKTSKNDTSSLSLLLNSKVNVNDNKYFYNLKLNGAKNILDASVNIDNDYLALKIEDVIDGKYIAIDQEGIQELFNDGLLNSISDSELDMSSYLTNTNSIPTMSDKDIKSLKSKYSTVLKDTLKKENFSKESQEKINISGKDYNATVYSLKINANDFSEILKNTFDTAKTDQLILDYIKDVVLSLNIMTQKEYDSFIKTTLPSIEKSLANYKKSIAKDTSELIIKLYTSNGKTLRTELEFVDTKSKSKNSDLIRLDNVKVSNNATTYTLSFIDNGTELLSIKNELNAESTKKVTSKSTITVEDITFTINSTIELNDSNLKVDMNFDFAIPFLNSINFSITSNTNFSDSVEIEKITPKVMPLDLNSTQSQNLEKLINDDLEKLSKKLLSDDALFELLLNSSLYYTFDEIFDYDTKPVENDLDFMESLNKKEEEIVTTPEEDINTEINEDAISEELESNQLDIQF